MDAGKPAHGRCFHSPEAFSQQHLIGPAMCKQTQGPPLGLKPRGTSPSPACWPPHALCSAPGDTVGDSLHVRLVM